MTASMRPVVARLLAVSVPARGPVRAAAGEYANARLTRWQAHTTTPNGPGSRKAAAGVSTDRHGPHHTDSPDHL
jgi:hypothetical protein